MTPEYPHVTAAFINAIAEEGTKDEAILWLQKQWNETCYWKEQAKEARSQALEEAARVADKHVRQEDGDPWNSGWIGASEEIAAAIRALKK